MEDAGVPCGRIRTVDQVLTDPHVNIREMVVELEHSTAGMIKLTGVPTKLSLTPGAVSAPPPTLGQHTDQILTELGYTKNEINDLRLQGIV
jgi:crotonobetainyl-CoA:carnitine CoA-transferase CaiB-like acyl-CoA transferase